LSVDSVPTVRPATPADLLVVEAIERASFVDPWPRSALLQELKTDRLRRPLAAERGGRLIGYLMGWFVADELHIINLAVDSQERCSGIGTLLLTDICAEARRRKCRLATLEVRDSNVEARGFYERNGFETRGRRRGYYRDPGEDAVIMTLDLAAEI